MPLLWRQLIRSFLSVFLLCVTSFIAVLMVTRFEVIAKFAATGAPKLVLLQFVLYQIPFILFFAIPISSLIASILLFQRMSRFHELTALRASGLGLVPVTFPILACGALLALLNFAVISEMAPRCRLASKSLAYQMTAINPLCLLQKDTLIRLKKAYIDMKILKSGSYAEDVVIIMPNFSNQRLGLTLAKKLYLQDDNLVGKNVTFISSLDSKEAENYDHLIIENQEEMQTQASKLSQYLRSSDWGFSQDYLTFRMLQAKNKVEKGESVTLTASTWAEMTRRISLGLAAFTFTLIGAAFGIEIGRTRSLKSLFWTAGLSIFYIVSFIIARSLKHDPIPALFCYILPHLIIPIFCIRAFNQVSRGHA